MGFPVFFWEFKLLHRGTHLSGKKTRVIDTREWMVSPDAEYPSIYQKNWNQRRQVILRLSLCRECGAIVIDGGKGAGICVLSLISITKEVSVGRDRKESSEDKNRILGQTLING